jgi:hypothetical protein
MLSHHTFPSKTTIQCSSLTFVVTKDFGKGSQSCTVYNRYIDKSDTEQTDNFPNKDSFKLN